MEYAKLYPFWEHLTEPEKEKIKRACYRDTYEKGRIMHRGEDNCMGLVSVLHGQLRTYILSDEGREVTLFRVHDEEVCVLSTSCLMDSIAFDVFIEATEDTEILVLPSICLNDIMKKNPYVELYLYQMATEKFSEVMWTMQQILFQRIDQRVAGFLWGEFTHTGDETLNITHDVIAKNIGSAREVVTKTLKYLAQHNAIELKRGKIIVLDTEKLKSFL
ncbi:MAG: Crp/Fnr family transcriptional regulator [Lachnospiraceae bacterium]|nr:Crp/Fnr family transcriptional regulator [Lachnospiraceae bacterium]